MKKQLFLFCLSISFCFLQAQQPYIGTTTVIPQNPTPNDFIKIVTNVTTANQSIQVDLSYTVTGQQIRLKNCYSQGMLTATQNYIDTFMIGQLPAGNYQIIHKAYLSSAQQWCNATDSNFASPSFVVFGITGIGEHASENTFHVYPNPSSSTLYFQGAERGGEVSVFSTSGSLIRKAIVNHAAGLDISNLAEGLYFIRFRDKERSFSAMFVKAALE